MQHIHYNDTLYCMNAVSLPLLLVTVHMIISFNERVQGEVKETSHYAARLSPPPQTIALIQLVTKQTSTFLNSLLTCVTL